MGVQNVGRGGFPQPMCSPAHSASKRARRALTGQSTAPSLAAKGTQRYQGHARIWRTASLSHPPGCPKKGPWSGGRMHACSTTFAPPGVHRDRSAHLCSRCEHFPGVGRGAASRSSPNNAPLTGAHRVSRALIARRRATLRPRRIPTRHLQTCCTVESATRRHRRL